MANKCAICGAEVNLLQTQKLADGNCICRKTCRKKGFKTFDYVHADLYRVKDHLAQVERGTKLWNHYFISRKKTKDKTQKLKRLASHLYVAEDIGLMAYIQNDYKFMMFGKTTRACVYRIADLRAYNYENRIENNGAKEVLCPHGIHQYRRIKRDLRRDKQHEGLRGTPEVFRHALRSSEDPRKRLEYLEGTGCGNQERRCRRKRGDPRRRRRIRKGR